MTSGLIALLLIGLPAVLGYVIGSFSSGYVVGRLYGKVDLRGVGSGSTGATNTLRTLGPGAAILVGVMDIAKGALAVTAASLLVTNPEFRPFAQAAAGIGAVVGHCWPILLNGRGGRGVATALGAFILVVNPVWLISVAGFVLAIAVTRMVSAGSLAAAVGGALGYALFVATGALTFHWAAFTFVVVVATIIIVRHRANIWRIARGAEPRLGATRT